jgi:hypothetical protein
MFIYLQNLFLERALMRYGVKTRDLAFYFKVAETGISDINEVGEVNLYAVLASCLYTF